VDKDGAKANQLFIEFRQRLQKAGMFLRIPQDPGFMVIGPVVFRQGGGIPGPQLAEGIITEPAAGSSPLPDKE
jgi:hypothetical protein